MADTDDYFMQHMWTVCTNCSCSFIQQYVPVDCAGCICSVCQAGILLPSDLLDSEFFSCRINGYPSIYDDELSEVLKDIVDEDTLKDIITTMLSYVDFSTNVDYIKIYMEKYPNVDVDVLKYVKECIMHNNPNHLCEDNVYPGIDSTIWCNIVRDIINNRGITSDIMDTYNFIDQDTWRIIGLRYINTSYIYLNEKCYNRVAQKYLITEWQWISICARFNINFTNIFHINKLSNILQYAGEDEYIKWYNYYRLRGLDHIYKFNVKKMIDGICIII